MNPDVIPTKYLMSETQSIVTRFECPVCDRKLRASTLPNRGVGSCPSCRTKLKVSKTNLGNVQISLIDQKSSAFTFRNSAIALVVSVILGALGSGLWDVAIKPSAAWISQAVLYCIALGSDTVLDLAYANASVDPTVIPALFLLMVLACATTAPILLYLALQILSLIHISEPTRQADNV